MPLVSVCIPTYNFGRLIPTAIRSVLSQEFKDFELVVVDNSSTDNTEEVVASFEDPRVRYFRNPANLGFARNLQRAFEFAKGEFLQFLCADDYLYPGYLEKATAVLARFPDLAFVHTGHDLVDISGKLLERRIYPWKETVGSAEFLEGCVDGDMTGVFLSSVMMRREMLKRVGGVDAELKFSADYGIWFKLCFEGKVGYIAEPLTAYRIHDKQATRIFVPGLKINLVEYLISNSKKRGAEPGKYERSLLLKAVSQSLREFPRYRSENASLATLWQYFISLRKKHSREMTVFPEIFYVLASLLPPFLLKSARQFYLKRFHAPSLTP